MSQVHCKTLNVLFQTILATGRKELADKGMLVLEAICSSGPETDGEGDSQSRQHRSYLQERVTEYTLKAFLQTLPGAGGNTRVVLL